MSHGGGGSEKCQKNVTYYLNGPLNNQVESSFIELVPAWSREVVIGLKRGEPRCVEAL